MLICVPVGYTAYLSAVRVDATYNNPVMNVFVYLLSTASDRKAKKKPSSMCGCKHELISTTKAVHKNVKLIIL